MKVKFKSSFPTYRDLTPGNVYLVIGIEAGDFRIMNDHGRPYLYPKRLFTLVDKSPGLEWRQTVGADGEPYAYAPPLSKSGFFEDYFDGKRTAIATLQTYLLKVAAARPLLPPVLSKKPGGRNRAA